MSKLPPRLPTEKDRELRAQLSGRLGEDEQRRAFCFLFQTCNVYQRRYFLSAFTKDEQKTLKAKSIQYVEKR